MHGVAGAVSSFIYDPYGRFVQVGASNLDFRYAGMYYLEEAALNLTRYRAYDSVSARWLNRDPIAEDGGINLYGYVEGDPVNFVDPRGLSGESRKYYFPNSPYILGSPANKYWAKKLSAFCDRIFDEADETPIKDLDLLHSKDTIGSRPDLENLSDDELLNSVRNPENNDPLKVNTETGKLMDGNSRAQELINRANDPNSSITPDTLVPVQPYTPDNSMFLY